MADKEIEIGIKATGGSDAAREVGRVEEALDSTNKSADDLAQEALDRLNKKFDDLSNEVDETERSMDSGAGSIDEVGDSMESSGKKAGGFSGWLKGVGGSMLGALGVADLFSTALDAVGRAIGEALAKQDEMIRAAAQGGPEIVRSQMDVASAMERLPTAAEEAREALTQYFDALDAGSDAARQRATDAQAIADAMTREQEAAIALREARGEIDGEAAREERRQLAIEGRIEKHERELFLLKQIEEQERKKAEAAEKALAIAEEQAEAAREAEAAFKGASGDRARGLQLDREQTELVQDLDRESRQSAADAEGMGRVSETNKRLADVQASASKLERLNPLSQISRLIQAYLEAGDTIKWAGEEADRLDEEFEKQQGILQKQIDEREAQLEERSAAAEEAEASFRQDAAAQGVSAASARDALDREMRTGGEVVRRENNAARTQGEVERAQARNREASQLAKDLENEVSNLGPDAQDSGLVETLKSVSARLKDGTNEQEIVSVVGELTTALQGAVNVTQETRAEITQLKSQIRNLNTR